VEQRFWWTAWFLGEDPHRGEHRTEVTEVTEGDLRFDGPTLLVDGMASGRERRASGKASHRGHGGHRGGFEVRRPNAFGGQHGFWAGKTRIGEKHRTEVTEEGFEVRRATLFVGQHGFWAGKTRTGESLTEFIVTRS
jgi:hypothetical protein